MSVTVYIIYLYLIAQLTEVHSRAQKLIRINVTAVQMKMNNRLYNITKIKRGQIMDSERKSVEIYLRIKGPPNPKIKSQFKLLASDTQIRFKEAEESEEQDIANQFAGIGIYKFQKIFRENALQEDIYNKVALDLVQSAIEGYNGTIFAYGQTGSGKTYTMTGGDEDPSQMGIIPRVINELYKQAETREEEISIKLRYMQIYKKNGYDLLHPDSKSKKLEDLPQVKAFCKADNFDFQNLSEHEAPTFEQAMKIYQYGDTNRIVCKTPSNDQSSRSHCIFMIGIKTKNKDTGLQQKATINLVDLAGSERIHYSGMEEKQAKEGISINLGLHYLSRVVLTLGEQSRGNSDVYVPYRDSLLTMALKSSMGGNCKTRMIATINPNPMFNPENIATCKFSQNLLAMQNKIKKNQFINPWDIIKGLKNQVEELKGEISRLKGQNVKQILQRQDYVKIHKMVNDFVASSDPATTLPINDRLYIRQYLSYMRTMIRERARGGAPREQSEDFSTAVSENYIIEVKNLKNQIQQKQNEIQLLLSLINHQKQDNPESVEENVIPVEQISEQKLAETVANTLLQCKKKRSYKVSAEDVEKNLIKPILLNKQESVEDAFKKFKDAHVITEDIDERQYQIKLKIMKKEGVEKKIKCMKIQRLKLNEKLNQIASENKSSNFPSFVCEDKSKQIEQQKQEIIDLDDKIKKKYQQLKAIELQINRLDLCKNKNTQKLKNQFEGYRQEKLRKYQQTEENGENGEEVDQFAQFKEEKKQQEKAPHKNLFSTPKQQSSKTSAHKISSHSSNKQEEQEAKVDRQQVDRQMQQFFEARKKLYSRGS